MGKIETDEPQFLTDRQNVNSFELKRLEEGTWSDVDKYVKVDHYECKPRITVFRNAQERTPANKLVTSPKPKIEIIAGTTLEHEVLLNRIRARIAPWPLLQKHFKEIASCTNRDNSEASLSMEQHEQGPGGLLPSFVPSAMPELSSISSDNVEEKQTNNLEVLQEQVKKLAIVDSLTAHGSAAVGSGATFAKLVAGVGNGAETVKFLADTSKCIGGVGAVFQLIALSAQGVSMCTEAYRGRKVLPVALRRIMTQQRYVLESLAKMMKPSRSANEIDTDFVFNVLKKVVCAVDEAETQIFRGLGRQILNAGDVQKVEAKTEELELMTVLARTTSRICALEENHENFGDGPHHVRPSLTAFFSGRVRELNALRDILKKHGSAVIARYGGVGKTDLMNAFADQAERDKIVPGGVYWMTVDGDVSTVIRSLAVLVEKLTRRRMSEEDQRNHHWVVKSLKQALSEKQGQWLLCLDNADDGRLSGILNDVCAIADPTRQNGWVVVTSRQGHCRVWARMKSDQKLVLEPLCVEDAMVTLWRQSRVVETGDADDEEVMNEIRELEGSDSAEYCALKEICGDDGAKSLEGLPLALVQAGNYIARFECSFAEYLDLFQSATKEEDLQNLMQKTVDLTPMRESQRSVWTTWRISVQQLSEKANAVLRSMAMLGQVSVGEPILNGILKEVAGCTVGTTEGMFKNAMLQELVHGSSLIYCDDRRGCEQRKYRMHRLVRRFILIDMEQDSNIWNKVYSLSLLAIHKVVKAELEREGGSFAMLPDAFGGKHDEFVAHALALIDHFPIPGQARDIPHVSKVEDIHRYCIMVTTFVGKTMESVHVSKHLLSILHHRQAETRKRNGNARLVGVQGEELECSIADAYGYLGSTLWAIGELEDAASAHKRSLDMYREIYGHNTAHADIAACLHNLAVVIEDHGNLGLAAEFYEESFDMYRAIFESALEPDDIAISLCHLGNLYRRQGRLEKALEMLEESLRMQREIHGHDKAHLNTAASLHNIAAVYHKQGKFEKAAEFYGQSIEMNRVVHGAHSKNSDLARSLSNLAIVYQELGKPEEALETMEESLEMHRAIHAANNTHPDIAMSLHSLANVHADQGKLGKAVKLYEKSIKMMRARYGADADHPELAGSLSNLGLVYRELKMLDKAVEVTKRSVKMYQAVHGNGKSHPDTAKALHNLGLAYCDQEKLDQAAEHMSQSLEMLRIVHGPDSVHRDIEAVISDLADVYEQRRK